MAITDYEGGRECIPVAIGMRGNVSKEGMDRRQANECHSSQAIPSSRRYNV